VVDASGQKLAYVYFEDNESRRSSPAGCCAHSRREITPVHSITSSARAMRAGGIVRPTVFAVLRLMIS
jgi:hypothetical protein